MSIPHLIYGVNMKLDNTIVVNKNEAVLAHIESISPTLFALIHKEIIIEYFGDTFIIVCSSRAIFDIISTNENTHIIQDVLGRIFDMEVVPIAFTIQTKNHKRVFLICSVRNATEEQLNKQANYVAELESKGYRVHYPPRDTNQNASGFNICSENFRAIIIV